MSCKSCGCSATRCGCCEGTEKLTPLSTYNRPGLSALNYRAGTHGAFLETMKARLAAVEVEAVGVDGQTLQKFYPLRGLTTRDAGDPSIALLDGWATVGDVLTFYQERIANEGYLRTATERRSVLELARLVGYSLRPGVASTVYLAYTLDDKQETPVEISEGARSQSIPGPDELPQSFETSENLLARKEWNNLQVRLQRPQKITFENALDIETIWVAGTNTNLRTGDPLLLVFDEDGDPSVVRRVRIAEGDFEKQRTAIRLEPLTAVLRHAFGALGSFVEAAKPKLTSSSEASRRVVEQAEEIARQIRLGVPPSPSTWLELLDRATHEAPIPEIEDLLAEFAAELEDIIFGEKPVPERVFTDPTKFIQPLLKPRVEQASSGLQLRRSLRNAFRPGADVQSQLLVNFAPQLKDTFYQAWSAANVETDPPVLKGVYALRVHAPLFGATVPRMATYDDGELLTPDQWDPWPVGNDEAQDRLFLDQSYDAVLPGSYAIVQNVLNGSPSRSVHVVATAQTTQRDAYGTGGKSTQLDLTTDWRGTLTDHDGLRRVLVHSQSEKFELIEEPLFEDIEGQEIELDGLYNELTSGRWVILSGERADIPGVTGVAGVELLMISGLRQDYDPTLPGDKTHTTLLLATKTAYKYRRSALTIYGNVVKATHGETRTEILGSGDGTQSFQAFTLKQPPLTFVPAPTPAGVESTLKVYVNGVRWHETDSLAYVEAKDRGFITKTDDDARTSTIFGDGVRGARLPTGVENVRTTYRSGIGKPGNVKAGQISLLQTRPLGVKEVINPLRSSGGADKESRDQARENAPLAVMALDRLVSLKDYEDFTRTFAGIGKASARRLSDGQRQVVHVTIAGADDIPIDTTSDLYRNLLIALRSFGDAALPVRVDSRELIALVASVRVRLAPDYLWDPVAAKIRQTVTDGFGFARRALGQPALLCELVSMIHNIEGVAYVDVDAFGGIPEKITPPAGTEGERQERRLLTMDEMTLAVDKITSVPEGSKTPPKPAREVTAQFADFEGGAIRPAQLAIFTPAVPDTFIVNQIL